MAGRAADDWFSVHPWVFVVGRSAFADVWFFLERNSVWINIKDSITFGNRAAVASITRFDYVNATGRPAADYFSILEETVSYDVIRDLIIRLYPGSENWVLFQCHFNPARQCFDVIVSHPSFADAPIGCELPRIERPERTSL